MILLVAAALAAVPDCAAPAVPPTPVQLAVELRGHQLGGVGIASLEAEAWGLTLLSFGGVELFTVSPAGVATGLEAWRPWLEQLPVERDLRVIFTPADAGRCRAGGGVVRTRVTAEGWERRWRGAGGRVCARREGDVVTIRDHARGYVLRMVVSDADG